MDINRNARIMAGRLLILKVVEMEEMDWDG